MTIIDKAIVRKMLKRQASLGFVRLPSRVRAPEPIKAPPQIQRAIDEWKKQETFAQICLKHGVNIHTAQRYLYGKMKKQPKTA